MSALRARIRADAIDAAARAAWEHDHPRDPWDGVPASVARSMKALVRPTVDTVLEHLDARGLLDIEPEPDTFPGSVPFDTAIRRAVYVADLLGVDMRIVHKGTAVDVASGDTWQDVAQRYTDALERDARR